MTARCRHACLALALLCGGPFGSKLCAAQTTPAPQTFESLQQSASKAQQAGNNEQALADYQQALAIQPNWREGLWAVATLSYTLNHYPDAIAALNKLTQLAPGSGAALSLLGLSEFENGDYPSARAHLEQAQSLHYGGDPAIAQVCAYHLALLLNRDSDFDRAEALLHSTFPQQNPPAQARAAMGIALLRIPLLPTEIDPAHDALIQAAGEAAAIVAQGDPQKSVAALTQLIAQYPQTPALHAALARALTAAGDARQAQAAQQQEAQLPHADLANLYRIAAPNAPSSPPDATAAWQQAMQDYSTRNYPATVAALKAWVQQKPDDGTAWAVMGLAEFELKDYQNARIHLERGQQLGLGASQQAATFALYHLALLLNRSGNFSAASALLATLAGYQPMAADVEFALGLSLLRIPALPSELDPAQRPLVAAAGQVASLLLASKYDDAFPLFQKLLAQYPRTPWLHYAYGTALESLSQYDEARTQFVEETKLSPQSALPWTRLASISLRQHQPQAALAAATTAVQLEPASADAHYVLGRALLEAGDVPQSITELEKAVSLAPNSPEPHFALARACARAGRNEQAAQERETFARLNALAEQQRAAHGSQAYQGPRQGTSASLLDSAAAGSNNPSPPQP